MFKTHVTLEAFGLIEWFHFCHKFLADCYSELVLELLFVWSIIYLSVRSHKPVNTKNSCL